MGTLPLEFHHFGLAASEPKRAKRFLMDLGYRASGNVFDPQQNANLVWCEHHAMPAVEIIYPSDTPGPLDNILQRGDSMIYHVCYQCDEVQRTTAQIKTAGHRILCVSEPKPAVLFDGLLVGFYMVRGFGLIELLQRR